MTLDQVAVEKLVEQITKEVLVLLQEGGQTPQCVSGSGATCSTCGQCAESAPDRAREAVAEGASRLSASLGVKDIPADIASLIDHTLLKPEATPEQIAQLCYEAKKYNFASVCVNPTNAKLCAELLKGSPVKVCAVVGFPLGATAPDVKAYEALDAIRDGACEIDMVINIGALKAGDLDLVERDISAVVNTCHANGAICKVIIEAALLTNEEKIQACTLAKKACADFVKTSTGFGPGGATVEDVALMRQVVGSEMGVKAAGGIRTLETLKSMVRAGATRIGASASVKIMQEAGRA
jgi:deoxyribose-phosphate aldolase